MPAELALEQLAGAGRARDDHALDAGPREQRDRVGGERPVADRHERLRQAAGGVAKALGLAAGEQDRLHQSCVRRALLRSRADRRTASSGRPMPS